MNHAGSDLPFPSEGPGTQLAGRHQAEELGIARMRVAKARLDALPVPAGHGAKGDCPHHLLHRCPPCRLGLWMAGSALRTTGDSSPLIGRRSPSCSAGANRSGPKRATADPIPETTIVPSIDPSLCDRREGAALPCRFAKRSDRAHMHSAWRCSQGTL